MTTVTLIVTLAVLAIAGTTLAAPAGTVRILVANSAGARASGPVSAGIPFKKGSLADPGALRLSDADGKAAPLQVQTLSKWPDGSCRWVLVDFPASVPASATAGYTLGTSGTAARPANPVEVKETAREVAFANGIVRLTAAVGGGSVRLETADGRKSADVTSAVEIAAVKRVSSRVVIDSFEVYARGPLRAAVSLLGRRLYSDGIEGPFSQRIEMFAGSSYVRVEDTFVYAHFPGTHAKPENALALWKVSVRPSPAGAVDLVAVVAREESEGLVVSADSVAFWGLEKPLDMSRWTDDNLIGEDCPGIALGLGKSCGLLAGFPACEDEKKTARTWAGMYAHTTPEVYASSLAIGDFLPETAGRFQDVEEGLRQILGFWIWFQDNDPKGAGGKGPWYGLLDWGDWQTRYANRKKQPTGWNYLEGRYGWDCNEMDTTLTLWSAFFHTGRPEYRRAAVAMSRHMMDVDVLNVDYRKYKLPEYVYDWHNYGAPWKEGQDRLKDLNTIGLGRRHNVQHWGNGVGDTRHTWNGGVIMYYYTSGNRRAYDTAINMAQVHMQRIQGYAAGEYCLSMWCLYNAWQLTGDAKYLDEFKFRLGVIHKLRLPDGSIPHHLDFDKARAYPEVDGEDGSYLDLTLDYISNALIDYHADTGDRVAREVLLGLAKRNIQDTPEGPHDYSLIDALRIFAWAYGQTGDAAYVERIKYHLRSLTAKPMPKKPSTAQEWLDLTDGVLRQHEWDIRAVGPAVRMAPYALKAVSDSEKK